MPEKVTAKSVKQQDMGCVNSSFSDNTRYEYTPKLPSRPVAERARNLDSDDDRPSSDRIPDRSPADFEPEATIIHPGRASIDVGEDYRHQTRRAATSQRPRGSTPRQEARATKTDPPDQGHEYFSIKIKGDGEVLQGNVGDNDKTCKSRNVYSNIEIDGGSMNILGNMSTDAFAALVMAKYSMRVTTQRRQEVEVI
ncbi:uncharacterized protein PAC_06614 [Phialocephala subalpina]|uniref:Uncharacterized protein n=1 Tax=Phialocephala subalpina TaxID=576137 RepID=A0A1L7WVD3_9HELO|nr:uncharacterized protein PAC_06614 [Phialocephala subalpina]